MLGGGGGGGGRKRERVAIRERGGPPKFGYREIDLKLTNKVFTSTKFLPRSRRDFGEIPVGRSNHPRYERLLVSEAMASLITYLFTSLHIIFSFYCKKEGNPPGPSLLRGPLLLNVS